MIIDSNKIFDYLRVDKFMKGMMESRALATAFELEIIDSLIENQAMNMDDIKKTSGGKGSGFGLLMDLLKLNRVIEESQGKIKLTDNFIVALPYRDIMLAKLQFANIVAPDFTDLFTSLVREPEEFYQNSRVIDLFGYNRCYDYGEGNFERTRYWMNITTTLTKYESPVCMNFHDFSGYRNIMDIGGNSGEFVLQICKKYPNISATVFDLPIVCDIGKKHVESEPEAERVTFEKGNAFRDPLPYGFDLVIFKSVLHDWPDKEAMELLTLAARSLAPGGTILIFERSPFKAEDAALSYYLLPFLLFCQSFRSPALYECHLRELGFIDFNLLTINLEMPFFLLSATKQ